MHRRVSSLDTLHAKTVAPQMQGPFTQITSSVTAAGTIKTSMNLTIIINLRVA